MHRFRKPLIERPRSEGTTEHSSGRHALGQPSLCLCVFVVKISSRAFVVRSVDLERAVIKSRKRNDYAGHSVLIGQINEGFGQTILWRLGRL